MKKSELWITPFLFLLIVATTSCNIRTLRGDGNVVSRDISISSYNEIQIQGSNIDLNYTQSNDAPSLKIECDQNILEALRTEVIDGELIIRPKNRQEQIAPTRFVITTNSSALKEFKMAGSGNSHLTGSIQGDEMKLELAGSGTITVDSLFVDKLNCKIAGSGDIILYGKSNHTNAEMAGSCKLKAFDLQTESLNAKMAGSNNIEITVNKEISVKIAGSGNVRYKGNADVIKQKIAGSGSISKVE